MSFFSKLKKHIIIPQSSDDLTTERAEELISKIVNSICDIGMETPAILFFETFKPLGYVVGTLGNAFASPFLDFFGMEKLSEYIVLLQDKTRIEKLVEKLERAK